MQAAWGKERIVIEPSIKCVPLPAGVPPPSGMKRCGLPDGRVGIFRGGFYIHRGTGSTTAGCIKVPDKDGPEQSTVAEEVFKKGILGFGASVPLVVRKVKR